MTGWNRPRAAARLLTLGLPEGLLEFLAEWEDERGEWQDPLEYLDPQWQKLDERVGPNDE
jgi:transposase